jgi:ABC-type ATPase involved in cell division
LNRSFDILQLGTVPLKVQDIDMVFQEPELLDLLHYKSAVALASAVWVHGRNYQDSQAHISRKLNHAKVIKGMLCLPDALT